MTESSIELVKDGLATAMKAEREGQYFYLMAAKTTDDPKGKEVFMKLAAEEEDHFRYLKGQYKSVLETGKVDGTMKLLPSSPFDGPNPIFSESLKARIKDAHFEMTALSVAIQLEADAGKFYREQAAQMDDVVAKTFYLELAEWENNHYKALLTQSENLKEEYWQQGDSPRSRETA